MAAAGPDVGPARVHHCGAQNGGNFRARIEKSYGPAANVADWLWLAQFENYQGHRAMFEAQSKNRMGLLIWMSHSCWPSLVWQTYDYYFEPTAAYFGARKATEPLHNRWNPANDTIEVVNYSAGAVRGLFSIPTALYNGRSPSLSRDRILPAIYSDGYVPLMPGERRSITTELQNADTRGEKPRIVVEGFNVTYTEK